MTKSLPNLLAFLMLAFMFALLFASAWNDSAVMDELAHLPAAYSYVTLKDMRLNPEHPPLIKDLAGLPLLFLNLKFPTDTPYWKDDVNGQWAQGAVFLYESGNDPDKILRLARLPVMLLAILLGWLLFLWARSLYGNKVALLTLFFYVLSPTFLAHSRYVTTDLGAAFGFFIGIASFLRFLERQTLKRFIVAALAFGIAQLLKFSLFLLVPVYFVLAVLWVFLKERERSFLKELFLLLFKIFLIGLAGFALVWGVYLWHVWNYPQERQYRDTELLLSSFGFRPAVDLNLWLIKNEILRPLGQYLLGLLMVIQRSAGGNTTYYLGEVSAAGWRSYFPVAYLLKETLAFHILTLLALVLACFNLKKAEKTKDAFFNWLKNNFTVAASLIFIAVYWAWSVKSPLNIGVRHVLPTFPFIYFLVSRVLARRLYRSPVSLLCLWIFAGMAAAFPFYLSYYNELVGTSQGYRYIVDSNYDWGQDLKRLGKVTVEDKIPKIYLDYFGGGSGRHYIGEKFEPWSSAKGAPPSGSYFALSATLFQSARGKPVKGFEIKPEDSYSWLKGLEPVKRAGTSIFIYRIP
ncbi:MAG: glycosyltransferase family 39 protein [bacterium]|nr:glycosyltransferase family 39 protein [bacterium]